MDMQNVAARTGAGDVEWGGVARGTCSRVGHLNADAWSAGGC